MADWLRHAAVLDFETLPTGEAGELAPVPVGVALRVPGKKARYFAWGHPTGNNCTWEDARTALGEVWESDRPVLNHNLIKFDQRVAEQHMSLPRLPWQRVHDTLPMLFLCDPRAPDYKLKSSAERLLGTRPEERDAVVDWLVDYQPIPGKRLQTKGKKSYAGAYIAFAPGDVVAPYACGDVDRAHAIAVKSYAEIERQGMVAAYDRERELAPTLLEMEDQGVRVDLERLGADVERYTQAHERLDAWLRQRLRVGDSFNLDSDALAQALVDAGAASAAGLGVTPTGKLQTNKAALEAGVSDPQVLGALRYRASLDTCLNVFMVPWLAVAQASGGLIFTSWHSTRNDHGETGAGARTGRLSSTPNFQNLAKIFRAFFRQHAVERLVELAKLVQRAPDEATRAALLKEKAKLLSLPSIPVRGLEPLPRVRSYIVPYAPGDVLADRDYNQQELRIAAHYEDGELKEAYLKEPWLDLHERTQLRIRDMSGVLLDRTPVKVTNFTILYGGGAPTLIERLGITRAEAVELKRLCLDALGGVRQLDEALKRRGRNNEPIRTLGGRVYYCEPARWFEGRLRDYAYRMLNLLVQGGAADATKIAIMRYAAAKPKHHRLLLTVHDELAVSLPREELTSGMRLLQEAMESVELDVPLLSEGKWSATNWAELQTYDKKGALVAQAA